MYSFYVFLRVIVAPSVFVCTLRTRSPGSSSGISSSSSSNGGYGDDDKGDLQKGPRYFGVVEIDDDGGRGDDEGGDGDGYVRMPTLVMKEQW